MWDKKIEEIFKQLHSNINGLTNKEAMRRLQEDGNNKIPTAKKILLLPL